MDSPQTSSANDIFSLSDQTLANRLQFIEEVRKGPFCTDPAVSLTPRGLPCVDWLRELGKRLEMLSKTRPFVQITTEQV